jgi:hypothetical protein
MTRSYEDFKADSDHMRLYFGNIKTL